MRFVKLQQGSPEWKRWRRDGLGGSDIANLLGLSPFADATPENLFREKVEGFERETNYAMRRGTFMEPKARRAAEYVFGYAFEPCCVEHEEQPWLRVSLDGSNWTLNEILEIKCPKFTVHDQVLQGICPDYYEVQCQWQLLVTDAESCIFASFNSSQKFEPEQYLAYMRIYPDAERQAEILEAAEEFWGKVCEAKMGVPACVA